MLTRASILRRLERIESVAYTQEIHVVTGVNGPDEMLVIRVPTKAPKWPEAPRSRGNGGAD